ncbi:RNA polymerase sigma-70 factor, ECF subfamily [Actinacidiphila alni]|uniref:RNA polymerase sigma-70 factor, ECF subfamily n=1 Tax=Actinacidiphila alni TaxID=380248 RepID=A0A1I2IZB6_9ACTN|nr:sigma-70 family RNA polymerase sigma factor [Actinacidiphila alni]SFF47624.1 RNA polymerase sigma-70 factor, ECF subfamily [Actinacidiphila alni]
MRRNRSVADPGPGREGPPASGTPDEDAESGPAGDEAFIRAVYGRHGTALLRYATGQLGGDTHRAQDFVQEAVLRAWKHSGSLSVTEIGSMRPWLIRVIKNLIIDSHRARMARPQEVAESELTEVSISDPADRLMTKQIVLEALGDLSQQHREVLLHVQYLDRSVAETAEILGIPRGTVKSRTHFAVRALRVALEARGYHV